MPQPASPAPAGTALLPNVVLFVRALRQAGLAVSLGQELGFIAALQWTDVGCRAHVFHTARALLVSRKEDLPVFDVVFQRFWRAGNEATRNRRNPEVHAPKDEPQQGRFTIVNYLAYKARHVDRELDVSDRSDTFSASELLQSKHFSEMSPEELATVRRLMHEINWDIARRRSRRLVSASRGTSVHLRRAMRRALRHGGLVLDLPRRRRKVKERPLVLLADISGSMEQHSRLILQFFHVILRRMAHVECFVFGTRLTRLTTQLRTRNIDRALDSASREVADWAGGTRIAESLGDFNRRWGRRVLRRGAAVVIISDGHERGHTDDLRREMRWLQRRCHRLIWLNPLKGTMAYEPRTEGMLAALESVDDFLPSHNLQSLHELAARLRDLPARRSVRRGARSHAELDSATATPASRPYGAVHTPAARPDRDVRAATLRPYRDVRAAIISRRPVR